MIDVSCAIIRNEESEILLVQRGADSDHPMKWEFPGGKIQSEENAEDSIIREIDEELSMDIIIIDELDAVSYDYGFKKIRLLPFVCDTLSDEPVLKEHVSSKWIRQERLTDNDLCEADIIVAGNYLEKYDAADHGGSGQSNEISDEEKGHLKEMLLEKGGFNACDILAENIIERPDVLDLLVKFCVSDEKQLAFRSSYCITRAEDKVPGVSSKYYGFYINSFPTLTNESVIRSFLKILNTCDYKKLSSDQHGIITESCFKWLNDGESAVAIKAYSMEALYRLTQIYPELINELRVSIHRLMDGASPGIKARGKYILKRLSS